MYKRQAMRPDDLRMAIVSGDAKAISRAPGVGTKTAQRIILDPVSYTHLNMVEAKANWLYELPQWDSILTEERRKELYKQQKASGTIRKPRKIDVYKRQP